MKNFTSGVARLCWKMERVFCQTARISVASESACVLFDLCFKFTQIWDREF